MARTRKKKALYEVVHRTQLKSSRGEKVEHLHPQDEHKHPDTPIKEPDEQMTKWPTAPRMVAVNPGRIELSIPYELAVAIILGIVLAVVMIFWVARRYHATPKAIAVAADSLTETGSEIFGLSDAAAEAPTAPADQSIGVIQPPKTNRIVIQAWHVRSQLEPVKQYYADCSIETEIRQLNEVYYLVTKEKYDNPERSGTDGSKAKQDIIKLGAAYKAPQGYGTFGPKPFHDAYGMRFDD